MFALVITLFSITALANPKPNPNPNTQTLTEVITGKGKQTFTWITTYLLTMERWKAELD